MLIIQSVLFRQKVETISYSDFIKKVNSGEISSVEISDQLITSLGKKASENEPQKAYRTVRVQDDKLVDLLKEKNVEFAGRFENPWVRNILSWILPLAILYLIWTVLFRRMG
jgi:cell division protease FtsH